MFVLTVKLISSMTSRFPQRATVTCWRRLESYGRSAQEDTELDGRSVHS